jgi:hypothetical protein
VNRAHWHPYLAPGLVPMEHPRGHREQLARVHSEFDRSLLIQLPDVGAIPHRAQQTRSMPRHSSPVSLHHNLIVTHLRSTTL